jgi:hypothetical protein
MKLPEENTMRSLFRPKTPHNAPKASPPHTRRSRRHQLGLESLEGRQLLSLGPELVGNAFSNGPQTLPVTASTPDGRSVVAWVDRSNASNRQLEVRLFNANGTPASSDIVVPDSVGGIADPAVAMDHDGDFVVTWTHEGNIRAHRFDRFGNPVGTVIAVSNSSLIESNPDVAMDDIGNFVVAFSQDDDVVAHRYNGGGGFDGAVDTQSSPNYEEFFPSVAMAADGRFAIVYEYHLNGNSANSEIWQLTYHANGALNQSGDVAASGADEGDPDVAMRDSGDFTVVYEKRAGTHRDIKAKRVSFNGQTFGEINIVSTLRDEIDPKIVMSRNGFGFAVSYDSLGSDGSRVGVAEVTGNNVVTVLPEINGANNGAMSLGPDGQYQLVYQRLAGADDNVFRRRGNGPK